MTELGPVSARFIPRLLIAKIDVDSTVLIRNTLHEAQAAGVDAEAMYPIMLDGMPRSRQERLPSPDDVLPLQ